MHQFIQELRDEHNAEIKGDVAKAILFQLAANEMAWPYVEQAVSQSIAAHMTILRDIVVCMIALAALSQDIRTKSFEIDGRGSSFSSLRSLSKLCRAAYMNSLSEELQVLHQPLRQHNEKLANRLKEAELLLANGHAAQAREALLASLQTAERFSIEWSLTANPFWRRIFATERANLLWYLSVPNFVLERYAEAEQNLQDARKLIGDAPGSLTVNILQAQGEIYRRQERSNSRPTTFRALPTWQCAQRCGNGRSLPDVMCHWPSVFCRKATARRVLAHSVKRATWRSVMGSMRRRGASSWLASASAL